MTLDLSGLSWCETVVAGGAWHLRRLSEAGRKPHGGADTMTLCGLRPSWDVGSDPTTASVFARPEYGYPCRGCVRALLGRPSDEL